VQGAEQDSRKESIAKTLAEVNRELADCGGGSWQKWGEKLAAFREDVQQVIAKKRPIKGNLRISSDELQMLLLDTMDAMPETNQVAKAVIHFDRQLKARGIDLIFCPLPDKSSAYPESLSDHVPTDGIVAIHVKQLFQQLLENDVEVIDLYRVYRGFRQQTNSKVPLYYESQDIHWRNKAAQLAGETVAQRLLRYDFVQQALQAGNPYRGEPFRRSGGKADQVLAIVNTKTNSPYQDAIDSPVILTADSYGTYCHGMKDETGTVRNGHLCAQVAVHVGMPLTYLHRQGLWGEMPVLMAQEDRDGAYLKGRRVVIWTCIARSFKQSKWPIVDLVKRSETGSASGKVLVGVTAKGTVADVSNRPHANPPYDNFLMEIYVKGLVDDKGRPVGEGDGVVRFFALRARKRLPEAEMQKGQQVTVKLSSWSFVKAQYGKIMTGTLSDVEAALDKPRYFGEMMNP
jgi:hypothetical protein